MQRPSRKKDTPSDQSRKESSETLQVKKSPSFGGTDVKQTAAEAGKAGRVLRSHKAPAQPSPQPSGESSKDNT